MDEAELHYMLSQRGFKLREKFAEQGVEYTPDEMTELLLRVGCAYLDAGCDLDDFCARLDAFMENGGSSLA